VTPRGWSRFALATAAAGGAVWAALLLWRPPSPGEAGWADALLLLAPLALVPLGLRLVPPDEPRGAAAGCWRAALALQLPAALALAAAFALPPGAAAAALALPWLAVAATMALYGLTRLRRKEGWPLPELAVAAGLAFPIVGAGWALLERAGIRPLGFAPLIVLLTAVHFHYAGFALPLATGLAGRALPGRVARMAALGVIAGVPLVAAGITASQLGAGPLLETAAAGITALAGLLTAWLHLRLAAGASSRPPFLARLLWAVAGLALGLGMVLAALYGSRAYLSTPWLDVPLMWALHGTANGLGFALCGLLAWTLAGAPGPAQAKPAPRLGYPLDR